MSSARWLENEARLRTTVFDPGLLPAWRVVRHRGTLAIVGPWIAGGALATATAKLFGELRGQFTAIAGRLYGADQ